MKAMQFPRYGGPEVLTLNEVPDPVPGPGQLLVRMQASSVNPVDWKLASGALRFVMRIKRPATPGFDLVGEVLQLGAGVTAFQVGQQVVARIPETPGGAAAEKALVPAADCVLLPAGISVQDAAALPLAGMTALQALRNDCGMKLEGESKRVLIVGGSGGVGHYAVQIAHQAGAHVTAICSGKRAQVVRELGADVVIDYREQDHFRSDAPYDIILDCAAKAPWASFEEVLTETGVLSQITLDPGWIPRIAWTALASKKRIKATMLKPNATDLKLLLDRMQDGSLKSLVGASFDYTELAAAWQLNEKGGTLGKIGITYPESP